MVVSQVRKVEKVGKSWTVEGAVLVMRETLPEGLLRLRWSISLFNTGTCFCHSLLPFCCESQHTISTSTCPTSIRCFGFEVSSAIFDGKESPFEECSL